ncbi:hypothetical protein EGW08_002403 [Elysia chlorotica]|uniref:Ig-like domain-containing protein n=1 Tax=Elysia chlorotica TaxID=188477 RepID=A0A3S1BJN9_ELYCH|nr:hypothetical protein EGW08_002403 [Elysia chlorotica]
MSNTETTTIVQPTETVQTATPTNTETTTIVQPTEITQTFQDTSTSLLSLPTSTTEYLQQTPTTSPIQHTPTTISLQPTQTTTHYQQTQTTTPFHHTAITTSLHHTPTTTLLYHTSNTQTTTHVQHTLTTTPFEQTPTTTTPIQDTLRTSSLQHTTTTQILQPVTTLHVQHTPTTKPLQHTTTTQTFPDTLTTQTLEHTPTTKPMQNTPTSSLIQPTPTMETTTIVNPTTPVPTLPTKPPKPPTETVCKTLENMYMGNVDSVTVVCLATNVYPEAECIFYRITNDRSRVPIEAPIEYIHVQSPQRDVYKTECKVSLPISELGFGIHSFQAHVYPNVTDGQSLVDVMATTNKVNLYLPKASHTCPTSLMLDYLCGKPTVCRCELLDDGWPKGSAQWFRNGISPISGPLNVSYHNRDLDFTHTCEAVSILGRNFGSTLQISTDTTCG